MKTPRLPRPKYKYYCMKCERRLTDDETDVKRKSYYTTIKCKECNSGFSVYREDFPFSEKINAIIEAKNATTTNEQRINTNDRFEVDSTSDDDF